MILFVQLVVLAPSEAASPPEQAERLEARATVDNAAAIVFLFTWVPSVLHLLDFIV
jgi:hypothetical protein